MVLYIESSLYRKPRFNEFAEKQPKRSFYRGIVNNCLFFLFPFCGVTLRYLTFWGRIDYCK